jgi:hypothetical protein
MADVLAQDALAALDSAIAGLLASAVPGGMTRTVRVEPRRIRPLGLGGYVGNHVSPDAGQFGRRVQARIAISITGGNDNAARDYIIGLGSELLSLSRAERLARGVQRLDRVPVEDARTLAVDVDFEFISTPSTGEGVITDLVLDIEPDG